QEDCFVVLFLNPVVSNCLTRSEGAWCLEPQVNHTPDGTFDRVHSQKVAFRKLNKNDALASCSGRSVQRRRSLGNAPVSEALARGGIALMLE
ncbi:MAG: hypothetical protein WBO37_16730, partial [Gammaproteobacteria bacterium]